ncbi:RNA polymerase II transcription factor-like protein B subunit 3 [Coleophoma crateriformis]|uniref:RNA polymerase II transcription factor B subunit 3 n=1 Tax=Coleophoma crateriformis TaxID=565419 RepID=A0A3D8SMK6_9HELO|nr:RNA polymerase II transcription factor-like protein B subunit 3 [Coleophoma crateriformis]
MPPRSRLGAGETGTSALSANNPSDDICPVCKSNRYLNPNLEFLINPECYHKMCSTCVDRIFTSGPASCPVPYCGKTLRKKGFHKAFFADLTVEREVDIRKRVGAIFNRRQDEFETLLDWNNYLEEVESLIFDLVEGTRDEKVKAEEKLKVYKEGNRGEIEENRKAGLEEADIARRREKAEKEAARQRRLAAYREEEEEKADAQRTKRDVLDRLATSNEDANKIAQHAQRVILKKTSARRNLTDAQANSNGSILDSGLTINVRGLKKKEAPIMEKPYDPFGGVDLTPSHYTLQKDYDNEWLGNAKNDIRHMAGGYSIEEYYARTMFEAFSGLGVFIEDEKVPEKPVASSTIGTAAAVQAAGGTVNLEDKMELDDVF